MKNRIIAFILATVTLFLCTVTVHANDKEEFISEVSLLYRDSLEEAKAAIKDTDWKIYEKDLNPKADLLFDDGVYLIYKTTTNVEEAITDLRVMDMYGGYSSTNYDQQLEKSRKGTLEIISAIRTAIAEFKVLYNEGDEMAILAYRQMNFYRDKKVSETSSETDMLMGDFFLNPPSDEKFVQVIMEGNTMVVANLVRLLAIGISGSSDLSLTDKLKEIYLADEELNPSVYHEDAVMLSEKFREIRDDILRCDLMEEEYGIDLDDPATVDEAELTEEDVDFIINYLALKTVLEDVKIGEDSLCNFIRLGNWTTADLYPIVKAFTKGQLALIEMGQLDAVIKYYNPTLPIAELTELVDNAEEELKGEDGEIKRVDVYLGVDRSIFEGSFAMTNEAARAQALTGGSWDVDKAQQASVAFHIAGAAIAALDLTVIGTVYIMAELGPLLAKWSIAKYGSIISGPSFIYRYSSFVAYKLCPAIPYITYTLAGLLIVAMGLAGVSTIYNYFNPRYTVIPNVMIDVRESDLGDNYIKYTAAKVYGEENKNADFNAYEGKEWIALYYTKDAHAGNCLTPNFKHSENDPTVERRHQGISMFGESNAFNLNSHVYDKDAPAVYLSLRYSTTKKAAVSEVPEVTGSIFVTGALYTLAGLLGVGIGAGGTIATRTILDRKRKEKQENNEAKENT